MGAMKSLLADEQEMEEPQPDGWDDPRNYTGRRKMALGKGKSDSKSKGKSSSKGGGKKDNSAKRYIASVWENEGRDGDTYLSLAVDNLDPDSEYHKGNLLWQDNETGKFYKVKSAAIYTADKGPKNLKNKIVLDLENEYHVEEIESEE